MTNTYTLTRTETKNKAAKYKYEVKDQDGNVVKSRSTSKEYVACCVFSDLFFGRLDLIGKGDHGKMIKIANGWCRVYQSTGFKDFIWQKNNPLDQAMLDALNTIAYLKQD